MLPLVCAGTTLWQLVFIHQSKVTLSFGVGVWVVFFENMVPRGHGLIKRPVVIVGDTHVELCHSIYVRAVAAQNPAPGGKRIFK